MQTSLRKTGNTAAMLLAGLVASLPGMTLAAGPGGMPPPGGGPPPGGVSPSGGPTMGTAGLPPTGTPGGSGRELRPPSGFSRSPIDDGFPPSGLRAPAGGTEPSLRWPSRDSVGGEDRSRVALTDAVSMVQQHFNATAVKTDTVTEDGQLVYRIRLLSADRSRVWTVNVDARTGQLR